jgi:hypothetical protein
VQKLIQVQIFFYSARFIFTIAVNKLTKEVVNIFARCDAVDVELRKGFAVGEPEDLGKVLADPNRSHLRLEGALAIKLGRLHKRLT